ncbi:hypothetical protein PV797_03680 [Clostridiaceae bacterium M8S5]|nr:hypothetical protein PV797_03680 [Clostridiaceae bacterium M8S5]
MNNILMQINTTLEKERIYLNEFNNILIEHSLEEADKKRILFYIKCCSDNIKRLQESKEKLKGL